jgi:hypothetical protein
MNRNNVIQKLCDQYRKDLEDTEIKIIDLNVEKYRGILRYLSDERLSKEEGIFFGNNNE